MLDDNNIKRSGGINLPDDMHVDRYSVPGGWIYIVSVEREENVFPMVGPGAGINEIMIG